QKRAAEVVAFLNLLHFLDRLPAAERGYAARRGLDEGDPDDLCDADDDELERAAEDATRESDMIVDVGGFEEVPEPRQVRTVTGWWRYRVIRAWGVLVFVLAYQMAKRLRDDALWKAVQNQPPPVVRLYLADRRNTRHREEAFRKLE